MSDETGMTMSTPTAAPRSDAAERLGLHRERRRRRLRCLGDGIALAQAQGLRYIVLVLPVVVGAADPAHRALKDVVMGAVESAFRFG